MFLENFKRFKRDLSKYHDEHLTVGEEINKSLLPKLKSFTVDTAQVVNSIYKGSEVLRTQGRAATDLFEQLSAIQEGNISHEQANSSSQIQSNKPNDLPSTLGSKQDNKMWKQRITLQKHLDSPAHSNTWKSKTMEKKRPLLWNSLNNIMKPIISKEYSKQQLEETIPFTEGEDTQINGTTIVVDEEASNVAEEKTTSEEGDVGPRPYPTTSPTNPSTKQTLCLRQGTQNRDSKGFQHQSHHLFQHRRDNNLHLQSTHNIIRHRPMEFPPRGRLQHFIHSWRSITTHPWPLSVIQDGYRI